MRWLACLVSLFLLGGPPDRTVITRDGKIHEGAVTRVGTEVVVAGAKGTVSLSAITVVADFVTWPEARRQCEARIGQATKLFEEASAKPDHDATRRRQLVVSLDICSETRDLLEILEKRAPPSERDALAAAKGKLFQFMRLVRDAKGATALADGGLDAAYEKAALEEIGLSFESLPESAKSSEITADLGVGQMSAIPDLASEDAGVRAAAAQKLLSPPAPHALAALSKAMRIEKDKDALQMMAEALSRLDLGPRLNTELSWAHTDEDVARRYAIIAMARRIPPKAACDFLGDCFRGRPPTDHKMRAAFASAFRKFRPHSIEELRETLIKTKDKELQLEAVRQLGMMRDRAALPSLKAVLGGSRELLTASFNALEKMGTVGLPLIGEMMGDGTDEVRRYARILAQRVTREEIDGVAELQKWVAQYRRHFEDDEKLFWKEQEEKDYPVAFEEFRIYDRKLPNLKERE